ncbi:hypothetical protein LZ32DRAFT_321980 [Colletotrichum eremochloae]|nr:hypothetical protein LZ32DRAFT_321980 [Colletotrichum eremochloae]
MTRALVASLYRSALHLLPLYRFDPVVVGQWHPWLFFLLSPSLSLTLSHTFRLILLVWSSRSSSLQLDPSPSPSELLDLCFLHISHLRLHRPCFSASFSCTLTRLERTTRFEPLTMRTPSSEICMP